MMHPWWMVLLLGSLACAQRTAIGDGSKRVAEVFDIAAHLTGATAPDVLAFVTDLATIDGQRPDVRSVGERQLIVLGSAQQVDMAKEILARAAARSEVMVDVLVMHVPRHLVQTLLVPTLGASDLAGTEPRRQVIVAANVANALPKLCRRARLDIEQLPRPVLPPMRTLRIGRCRKVQFVSDFEVEVAANRPLVRPVIDTVEHGCSVTIACVADQKAVIARAVVEVRDARSPMPTVLVATPAQPVDVQIPAPAVKSELRIVLPDFEHLLIAMRLPNGGYRVLRLGLHRIRERAQ